MTILDTIQRYRDQLDQLVSGHPERTDRPRPLAERPLSAQLQVFEQIAQGKIDRHQADPSFVAEVEEAVDQLLVLLCVPPDVEDRTIEVLPADLWERSELGLLLADMIWWLYQDDMVTMSEAAQLLYGAATLNEFQKLRTLVNKGELFPYIDPHEPNPQYIRRFRRSQILALHRQDDRDQEQTGIQPAVRSTDIVKLHEEDRLTFSEIGRLLGQSRQNIQQKYNRLKSKQ